MVTKTKGWQTTCGALFGVGVFLIGCGKPTDKLDQNWTPPAAIASSLGGLGGAVRVHKYRDTVIGVQVLHNGVQLLILDGQNSSWTGLQDVAAPNGYLWGFAAVDPGNGRILLPRSFVENEQLVMRSFIGTLTENRKWKDVVEKVWITDKNALLGDTSSNVKLNFLGARQETVGHGQGILNGAEAYIPYCLQAAQVTLRGQTRIIDRGSGPFANGIFFSTDAGKTWQMEKISDRMALGPAICRTAGYLYYFAGISPLWFDRRSALGGSWEGPRAVTETFTRYDGFFSVVGNGDTAHICWMDLRHNKTRFNLTGPPIENSDIYYRRRKDSDSDWSKEVHLSKGLLYCYAPRIAAEGDNVVVAWAGIRDAGKQHGDMGPNDIYYVTSKNAGKTWTSPLRVTDGAKDGITTGMPQVALLNGVIHLLYTQGAQRTPAELSPGLTKLGEGSWPIYYQRRNFPN